MKKGIHPEYYPDAKVTCACGNTWTTGSTKKEIHTDMCSECHPFFTGEQRIVDTAGQVERFERRLGQQRTFESKAVARERKRTERRQRGVVVEVAEEAEAEAEAAAPAPAEAEAPAKAPARPRARARAKAEAEAPAAAAPAEGEAGGSGSEEA